MTLTMIRAKNVSRAELMRHRLLQGETTDPLAARLIGDIKERKVWLRAPWGEAKPLQRRLPIDPIEGARR
jgi:hypothetical protein